MTGKLFNPHGTWMDRIDPQLLLRFWRKKNSPGILNFDTQEGISLMRISTLYGELLIANDKFLTGKG